MSQILSQVPRHLLKQEQRLTAQLIQAMDILQLNSLALESRISQEIDSNPALEYSPDEDGHVGETHSDATGEERPDGEQAMVVEEGAPQEFERLDNLVSEYDWIEDDAEYRGTKSRERTLEESDSKMEAMANTAARPISLQEHLQQQWDLAEFDQETDIIGRKIISYIDDAGRLTASLEQIGAEFDPPPGLDVLEVVLTCVQELEPRGIAARDLKECLLLQLESLPGDNALECSIIRDHFEDLQRNRLPAIAKALDVDIEDVKAALGVIGKLSLHPGVDVVERQVPPIVPDVAVEYIEEEDRYDVRLTRGNIRELRISPEFREALRRARDDKTSRDFIRQKIEAANAIIDAVRYRRRRLLDVAEAVVDAQRDFLDQGEQHIKVLRMSDLAERFGCDPSTISRTVDEKYIQTPQGIFPLRRF
ncbi:MAG: hypothetical protein JXO22_04650, partial [Phycisphaerae bacterium]|nr:hypothetical protein [Phycisphaerae bacterium]